MELMGDRIEQLLKEFSEQRDALNKMVTELEVIKSKVDRLFPETLDSRYVRFFNEKVQSATELFKAVLDIRKEIMKSLKDEIEMRKKFELKIDDDEELEKLVDVRSLARKIEKINETRKSELEKKVEEFSSVQDEMESLSLETNVKGEVING
jgi:hypothetical protein